MSRIPVHDHSGFNSGGLIASSTTVSVGGSTSYGSPVATGTALSDGTLGVAARADHVHTNAYIGTVAVSGTAVSGYVPTATGAGAATWQAQSGVSVADEGTALGTATRFDFVGAGVAATFAGGTATVTISGGTTTASIVTLDEGSVIGTASALNFTGPVLTASYSGGTTTIDAPGMAFYNGGTAQGTANILNVTGSGGSVSVSSGTAILNLSGGGGGNYTAAAAFTSGTSFPGSPATNDLCWRTDRSILYFYDGTRWLSDQVITVGFATSKNIDNPISTGQAIGIAAVPYLGTYSLWLVRCDWAAQHDNAGSAPSSSNKWNLLLNYYNTSSSRVAIATIGDTSGIPKLYANTVSGTIGAVLSASAAILELQVTITGTPPNLYPWGATLLVRLIG